MKDMWLGRIDYEDFLEENEMTLLEDLLIDEYTWRGVRSYFYNPDTRILSDENGWPIFNINCLVSPNMFFLFTHRKETVLLKNKKGELMELVWRE
jgi:hypothetical protein